MLFGIISILWSWEFHFSVENVPKMKLKNLSLLYSNVASFDFCPITASLSKTTSLSLKRWSICVKTNLCFLMFCDHFVILSDFEILALMSCIFSYIFFLIMFPFYLFIFNFPVLAPRPSPNLVAMSMGCFLANELLAFLFCDCVH